MGISFGAPSGVSLSDLLAQLGIVGAPGAAPQPYDASGDAGGPGAVAPQPYDASGDAGGPMPLSFGAAASGAMPPLPASMQGAASTSPGAPAAPAMSDASGFSSATFPPGGAASDPTSALPPIPQWTPRNPVGDVLDRLFLGGAIEGVRGAQFKHQVQAYQLAVDRLGLQRQYGATAALPSSEQPYAVLGGPAAITELAKMHAPMAVNADQRVVQSGQTTNAPTGKWAPDATSGTMYNDATGGTGATLGGGYKEDSSGNVVSERTGQATTSVPTFQHFPRTDATAFPQTMPQGPVGAGASAPGGSASGDGAAAQAGGPADVAYLAALGRIESRGNNAARNGSSTGIYQFQPKTFAAMGGTNIADPAQQAAAALKYRDANAAELRAAGLGVTPGTLYLAHQQGAAGARALLSADPSANAVQVLQQSGLYKNSALARRAITGNGGNASMTAGDFAGMWNRKFSKAYGRAGGDPAQVAATAAGADQDAAPGGVPQAGAAAPGAPSMSSGALNLATPGAVAQPLTPKEVAALGFAPGTVAVRTPTGDVEVKQKPQEAGKNTTGDLTRVQTLRKQADDANRVSAMAADFMKLNGKNGTGPIYSDVDVSLPFMHHEMQLNPSHFLARASNPDFAAMESLTSRAAPLLRPEGSGRIMQNEYANFLQSFPNVRNRGEANQQIAAQLQSEAESRRSYADFMAGWLQNHGTLTGADQAFTTQQAAHKAAAAGPKMLTYNPKTGALE